MLLFYLCRYNVDSKFIRRESHEKRHSFWGNAKYKIIAVDDESGILDTLGVFLEKEGYTFTGITDPIEAIERVKTEHFDLMLLDFIMTPVHGDQVVEEIRKFNKDLYILLLTGHKDLAPPLDTIKRLDIQGYCEKVIKWTNYFY